MKCYEKRRHLDKSEAKSTLQFLRTRFRQGLTSGWSEADIKRLCVYRCPECRFWHLGKQKYSVGKHKYNMICRATQAVRPTGYWKSCYEILNQHRILESA